MTDWEILETVGTEQEALLIAGFLESREVPVKIESRSFRQEPVTFGALAQVRLKVPRAQVDEARRLLEARRHRFLVVDGEGRGRPAVEAESDGGDVDEEVKEES